jgi:hypothetical protein
MIKIENIEMTRIEPSTKLDNYLNNSIKKKTAGTC